MKRKEYLKRVKNVIRKMGPALMCEHILRLKALEILGQPKELESVLDEFLALMGVAVMSRDMFAWDGETLLADIKKPVSTDLEGQDVIDMLKAIVERPGNARIAIGMAIGLAFHVLRTGSKAEQPTDMKTEIITSAENVRVNNSKLPIFQWANLMYALLNEEECEMKSKSIVTLALAYQATIRKETNYAMIWKEISNNMEVMSSFKQSKQAAFEKGMEHSNFPKVSLNVAAMAMKELGLK